MLGYYIFHITGSIVMGILGCIILFRENEIQIKDIAGIILMMLFSWYGLLALSLGYLSDNSDKILFKKDIDGKWRIYNDKNY